MEALVANFYSMDTECQRVLEEANARGAERVFELAKVYCPVDTGFMRDHLRIDGTKFTWSVGWDADDFFGNGFDFYAEYVEYGTIKMAARLPLTHAYEDVYPLLIDEVSAGVQDAIERRRAA